MFTQESLIILTIQITKKTNLSSIIVKNSIIDRD